MFKYFIQMLFGKLKFSFFISIIVIIVTLPFSGNYISILDYIIICFIVAFIYSIIEGIHFYIKNKSYKIEHDYLRELPRDYSPSMVSFLTNMKIENKKDILADLIFLEQLKIIKINDDKSIEIQNDNPNWKTYEKHLEYLLDVMKNINNLTIETIINKKDIYNNYKNFIVDDLKACDLLSPYSVNKLNVVIIFILFIIIRLISVINMSSILSFLNNIPTGEVSEQDAMEVFLGFSQKARSYQNSFNILITSIIALIAMFKIIPFIKTMTNSNYMRSNQGKKDVSLWLSYYKFIKDFSIMEERNLEEKSLWGYYFAYGLALGINTSVIKKYKLEYEKYIIK